MAGKAAAVKFFARLKEARAEGALVELEARRAVPAGAPKAHSHALHLETHSRVQFKDVTRLLQKLIEESGVESGECLVFVPHTTAAVLVNENDDPNLQADLDRFLQKLAPRDQDYGHNDGNCDAHLKASLIGASKTLMIENGKLVLGRWQGVFLCEFDGPRRRDLRVKIIPD